MEWRYWRYRDTSHTNNTHTCNVTLSHCDQDTLSQCNTVILSHCHTIYKTYDDRTLRRGWDSLWSLCPLSSVSSVLRSAVGRPGPPLDSSQYLRVRQPAHITPHLTPHTPDLSSQHLPHPHPLEQGLPPYLRPVMR